MFSIGKFLDKFAVKSHHSLHNAHVATLPSETLMSETSD